MFKIGDRVVYPGHGVAEVVNVVSKKIGNQEYTFYELMFARGEVILVPVQNNSMVRSLSSSSYISDIMVSLSQPLVRKSISGECSANWKQRNKEYQLKIHSGDLRKISEIYKELKCIERHKELSYCEKSILEQTETLLAQEIALVKNYDEGTTTQLLRGIFEKHSLI